MILKVRGVSVIIELFGCMILCSKVNVHGKVDIWEGGRDGGLWRHCLSFEFGSCQESVFWYQNFSFGINRNQAICFWHKIVTYLVVKVTTYTNIVGALKET